MEQGTLMFCTDTSMDSIMHGMATSSPSTTSSACSTPTLAKFPMAGQSQSESSTSEAQPSRGQVAVIYSREYTPEHSFSELFDLEKLQKSMNTMRSRNLPGTFFDQASASSSTSHSRDSIDSAVANSYNSPQRNNSMVPPPHSGDNAFSAHLSLKRTSSKAKAALCDVLSTFDSKTRSLPCSFSPSQFADPNNSNNSATLFLSNLNSANNNRVQLESFSTLQRGLQQKQPRQLLATSTPTSVSTNQQQLPLFANPNMLYNLQQQQQQQAFYQLQQQHNHATLISQQNQLGGSEPVSQQVQLNSPNQLMQAVYRGPSQLMNQQNNQHPKGENTFFHLQELENERNCMKKRQLELMQAKLIGPNSNRPAVTETQQMQQANLSFSDLQQRQQMQQLYNNLFNQEQQVSNQTLQSNTTTTASSSNSSKPQSRQESIDSGLDLIGYSSSSESTNRVSPELYMQMSNTGTLNLANSTAQQLHLQQQQQQFTCSDQFAPAGAGLNQKMMSVNPQTSNGGPSSLFAGPVVNSNGDIVSQVSPDNGSGRFSSNCKTTESNSMAVDGNNAYLNCFNGASSLLDEYIDSMSVASSPSSTLDGNGGSGRNSTTPTNNLPSAGRPPMVPTQTQPINENASGDAGALYDDNFLNSLLNGTEQVDLFDFNGNFNLTGHGGLMSPADLQAGFSYNL